eukprot:scaffold6562_cov163-Amphora_coffeaeformis.AAC.5
MAENLLSANMRSCSKAIGCTFERIAVTKPVGSGSALIANGVILEGIVIQNGLFLLFRDSSIEESAIAEESDTLKARIVSVDQKSDAEIAEFVSKKRCNLPIDKSLVDALVLRRTYDSMLEHLRKGGIWVYPILGFALIRSIIAMKLVQIRVERPNGDAEEKYIAPCIYSMDIVCTC